MSGEACSDTLPHRYVDNDRDSPPNSVLTPPVSTSTSTSNAERNVNVSVGKHYRMNFGANRLYVPPEINTHSNDAPNNKLPTSLNSPATIREKGLKNGSVNANANVNDFVPFDEVYDTTEDEIISLPPREFRDPARSGRQSSSRQEQEQEQQQQQQHHPHQHRQQQQQQQQTRLQHQQQHHQQKQQQVPQQHLNSTTGYVRQGSNSYSPSPTPSYQSIQSHAFEGSQYTKYQTSNPMNVYQASSHTQPQQVEYSSSNIHNGFIQSHHEEMRSGSSTNSPAFVHRASPKQNSTASPLYISPHLPSSLHTSSLRSPIDSPSRRPIQDSNIQTPSSLVVPSPQRVHYSSQNNTQTPMHQFSSPSPTRQSPLPTPMRQTSSIHHFSSMEVEEEETGQSQHSRHTACSESTDDLAFERFIMSPPRISEPTALPLPPQQNASLTHEQNRQPSERELKIEFNHESKSVAESQIGSHNSESESQMGSLFESHIGSQRKIDQPINEHEQLHSQLGHEIQSQQGSIFESRMPQDSLFESRMPQDSLFEPGMTKDWMPEDWMPEDSIFEPGIPQDSIFESQMGSLPKLDQPLKENELHSTRQRFPEMCGSSIFFLAAEETGTGTATVSETITQTTASGTGTIQTVNLISEKKLVNQIVNIQDLPQNNDPNYSSEGWDGKQAPCIDGNEDDDSLFDFEKDDGRPPREVDHEVQELLDHEMQELQQEEENKNSSNFTKEGSQNSANPRYQTCRLVETVSSEEEDSYSSFEDEDDLAKRSQEAWTSRRNTLRAPGTESENSNNQSSNTLKESIRKGNVSFGGLDTIHHFDPEESEDDEEFVGPKPLQPLPDEGNKAGGVKEAIKDILLLGSSISPKRPNPNQRKATHNPATNGQIQHLNDDVGTNNEIMTNFSDETNSNTSTEEDKRPQNGFVKPILGKAPRQNIPSRTLIGDTGVDDDMFMTMLSYMEGGIGVFTNVLGITGGGEKEEQSHLSSNIVDDGKSHLSSNILDDETSRSEISAQQSSKKVGDGSNPQTSITGILDNNNLVGYASGLIFGSKNTSSEDPPAFKKDVRSKYRRNREFEQIHEGNEDEKEDEDEDEDESRGERIMEEQQEDSCIVRLEEDPRLIELAIQGARSMHQIIGLDFDENIEIDIIDDVKFVVVELQLPLGVIFQEDDSGCWVTKVMPNGNAARHGGVLAGDQLAAVNGQSAIGMKVDEICALIASASQMKEIELTYLRYIGPFKQKNIDNDGNHEEGYEVESVQLLVENLSSPTRQRSSGERDRGTSNSHKSNRVPSTPTSRGSTNSAALDMNHNWQRRRGFGCKTSKRNNVKSSSSKSSKGNDSKSSTVNNSKHFKERSKKLNKVGNDDVSHSSTGKKKFRWFGKNKKK